MKVLGLSFDYHDSAAAIVIDGKVVAAAEEERFSRIKHDRSFPRLAIDFCLQTAGINVKELDAIVFHEDTFLKFDRIIKSAMDAHPESLTFLSKTIQSWVVDGKFETKARIFDALGVPHEKIHYIQHHQSHSASAYFNSPFSEATVVTLDGVGEYETFSISEAKDNRIRKIRTESFPNSIGLFYSAFTAYLGFEVNEGEYKVMGMSAYGKPLYADKIRPLIKFNENGGFVLDQKYFNFSYPDELPFNQNLIDLLGEPRKPESSFIVDKDNDDEEQKLISTKSLHYANIASSVQLVTEEAICHLIEFAIKLTGIKNIAMAGGVALNSLANGRVQREITKDIYIHPAAGDGGNALGAAQYWSYMKLGVKKRYSLNDVYLGQSWTHEQIISDLTKEGIFNYKIYDSENKLTADVARYLANGEVVGWFQGRFEWGPRALGARSILADPTRADMQKIVNEKIKFREPFRPFAPAVLSGRAHEYFEIDEKISLTNPENFMLSVAKVRIEKRDLIPAVTHADGSARIQLVNSQTARKFSSLLSEFEKIRGVPILMNTSFNLRGEPMVASPVDALRTFSWSGMDTLVLENIVVRKENLLWI